MDSFEDFRVHRLASCMDLSVEDLFIAKSISNVQPTKMLGEWVNDVEHPRDTSEAISYTLMGAWNPSTTGYPQGR
jgi:hypothetical protein